MPDSILDNVLIRASAGTGKTFQLTSRYLRLLLAGAEPDEILATTFTRKAAAEILDRIVVRLAEAAQNDQACQELSRDLHLPALQSKQCVIQLEKLLQNLHRLQIGTLDSFFLQIARSFSLDLGLPSSWQIMEEFEEQRLREQAVQAVLQHESTREISRLMHLMTKGEAERSIGELLRETVNRLYLAYLETSRVAWEQFPQLQGLGDDEINQAIDHLRDVDLPDSAALNKAHQQNYEQALRNDWEQFIKKGVAKSIKDGKPRYGSTPIPDPMRQVYEKLIRHTTATLVQQLSNQTSATYQLIDKFNHAYEALKQNAHSQRFDDITRRLADTADDNNLDLVEFRLDQRVTHILLDEFQDTSASQWKVLRPFAQRITRGKPLRVTAAKKAICRASSSNDEASSPETKRDLAPTFFCVGDAKQAIYGWRGGAAEIFEALEGELGNLTTHELACSFRSSQAIIDTVNQIFSKATQHDNLGNLADAVCHWCELFPEHSTAKKGLPGYACLVAGPHGAEDEDREDVKLQFAAQRILKIVQNSPHQSVGVLARRNKVVGRLVYELQRLGVAASEEGGNPLTDSAAVQLLLSTLRLADHPGDLVSREHVVHSPLGTHFGLQAGQDDSQASRVAQGLRRALLNHGYGTCLHNWSKELSPLCNTRDWRRLTQLVDTAYVYDSHATLRSRDFVRYIETHRVLDPSSDPVRVMTVHQAKGLQFDSVVLVDLDSRLRGQPPPYVVGRASPIAPINEVCIYRNENIQSLLPGRIQKLFQQAVSREVAEDLCVLYVALTRAVHALHMIIAPTGSPKAKAPRTAAGILRAALTNGLPAEGGAVLYEHGDPHWYKTVPASPRPSSQTKLSVPASSKSGPFVTTRWADPADETGTRLQRISPSSLEGGPQTRLGEILSLGNSQSRSRGSLFHKWFEQIHWLDDGKPDLEQLRTAACSIDAGQLDLRSEIERFMVCLEQDNISQLLRRSFYLETDQFRPPTDDHRNERLEVRTEQRFAVRIDQQLLTGVIDRLVLVYAADNLLAADIVDFKTDHLLPGDTEQLHKRQALHEPQLESYRRAAQQIFSLPAERVTARLVFVFSENCHDTAVG